jgi:hypothetical protein
MNNVVRTVNVTNHGLGVVYKDSRLGTTAYTCAEFNAYALLGCGGATDDPRTPHTAGNEIIALAEKIKAERAAMTLDLAAKE